jgi:hypothetical protein
MDDRDEPVAVGVAVAREPVVVQAEPVERFGREPGLVRRLGGDQLPGEREQRGLDVRGAAVATQRMGGVERRPPPAGTVAPEDRVGDKAVEPASPHQRPQLLAGAGGLEVAPHDRVEAGIPIPLVPVAWRGRACEAVRGAVGEASLAPVAREHPMRLGAQEREPPAIDY